MNLLATPGTILLAILALGVLIIVHEGGHFLVARLSGMRVDRFSIGFGPVLWSVKRGETTYQIAAIPLGGYVQIAGLNPGEEGMTADDPRAYPNRPVWQRLATIFAGPGTNYIFAVLLLLAMFFAWGVPGPGKSPIVADLVEGKPAAAAGFMPEDEIVAVSGTPVKDVADVLPLVNASQGKEISVDLRRAGKPLTLKVTPQMDGGEYRMGVQLDVTTVWEQVSAGARIERALVYPIEYSRFVLAHDGRGRRQEHRQARLGPGRHRQGDAQAHRERAAPGVHGHRAHQHLPRPVQPLAAARARRRPPRLSRAGRRSRAAA